MASSLQSRPMWSYMWQRFKASAMSTPLFFFSSRRRHTRYIGDWSSDVCSSDLLASTQVGAIRKVSKQDVRAYYFDRSEERRVGKECRSLWLPADLKKRFQLCGELLVTVEIVVNDRLIAAVKTKVVKHGSAFQCV